MRNSTRAGKAFILALVALPLSACDGASPFGGGGQAAIAQSSVTDPQLRAFYEARQWQAAWDRKSEKALLEVMAGAMAHGLKPSLFLKEAELPEDRSARDAALSKAALSYATALARGYVDPSKVTELYTLPRAKAEVATGLAKAVEDGDVAGWFASLPPQTDEYRALSKTYADYLRRAGASRPEDIAAGKPIDPGQRDSRVPAIAAALAAIGYAPAQQAEAAPPTRYTGALVDAVKRLQGDLGLDPDGIIGADTIDALNVGPQGRARQLAIAMERLRWLQREAPATRIDVNTAAAVLNYWRDGKHIDRRNVVVGEPGWETPQLGTRMIQLVANPMWRVPDSILEDELSKKSAAYLAANGFEYRDGRLIQRSGPKNALGAVKFDLDNKHAIYLHDTPAKTLFTQPERHRSHGCIRVHNALQFAALIASQDGVLDRFRKAAAGDDEDYIKLKSEIPVRLLYHTAFWDGARVQFRPDVYGWDDLVGSALGLLRGPVRKPWEHKQGADVGP